MDIRKVKKLIEMLEASAIDEIEIHEKEDSVRVSRNRQLPMQVSATVPGKEMQITGQHNTAVTETAADTEAPEAEEPEENIVRSPMVGIFYEAQSPGKPAFVELGQTVKKGDVLCIIEAMKIMNQVESEKAGIISRIMAANGEPVEYSQPLFIIRAV